MTEIDKLFTGAILALYDRHLGPMLFEPYAADLAARVARLAPRQVLETAASTGIVTRALHGSLPSGVSIVATDLNQPMLDHAAKWEQDGRVAWRRVDATALPFADGSFDAVICTDAAKNRPETRPLRGACDEGGGYRKLISCTGETGERRVVPKGTSIRIERRAGGYRVSWRSPSATAAAENEVVGENLDDPLAAQANLHRRQ
jgi:Methyltransferase domain